MKNLNAGVRKILVVEDEPAISDLCRRVLTSEGFKVDIALNGMVARDMLAESQYDLCLLDIKIPVVNGEELYHWLKEEHLQQASRVLFTTGDVMGGGTQRFLEQAARPFLPKPFAPDELKSAVNEALKQTER